MGTTSLPYKRDFKGVDLAKFILAVLVVAGHTHPFEGITEPVFMRVWDSILLIVVPYFFMAAGFFLFSKVYQQQDKTARLMVIWAYLKRIFKLYIYWTAIFLPITLWRYATDDLIFEKDMVLFVRGTVFFGENYYSWPLWFLLSMIYSIAFIYLLVLFNVRLRFIFVISTILFIMAMVFNYLVKGESKNIYLLELGKAIKYLFLTGRLFTGMFYLVVGGLIALNKIKLSVMMMVALASIAIVSQFFDLEIISPIMYCLLPITIFYMTINLRLQGLRYCVFLRKCSTVKYFTHMIVFFVYTLIFRKIPYFGWDAFVVSALVPILITPLIIRYEDRLPILKELFG